MSVLVAATVPSGEVFAQKRGTDLLADRVDAIVVGEVLSTGQSGMTASGVLAVTRTVKGRLLPNDRANVSWNLHHRNERDLKGIYGMWFLRESNPDRWSLLQLSGTLYLPLSKGRSPEGIMLPAGSPTISKPVTVGDQIAAEIVAALQVYQDRSDIRPLATTFLASESTPFVKDLYRVLRASPDPELKFIGLAAMLRLNDLTALNEMAEGIDRIPKLVMCAQVLAPVMSRRESSPEVIQKLGRFAASSDPDIQYASADALEAIHTRETLPFLVQLLDSPRQDIRQLAMMGLARFVNNLPIETPQNVPNGRSNFPQGPAPYRTAETDRHWVGGSPLDKTEEPKYIQFWKSWWAKVKGELVKP